MPEIPPEAVSTGRWMLGIRRQVARRCPVNDDLDLSSELDAAEDIVMGRAESVVTEVCWGVRYRSDCGQHVTSYGDEKNARDEITRSNRLHRDMKADLLRCEVTTITTPWEEMSR